MQLKSYNTAKLLSSVPNISLIHFHSCTLEKLKNIMLRSATLQLKPPLTSNHYTITVTNMISLLLLYIPKNHITSAVFLRNDHSSNNEVQGHDL